MAHIFAEPNKDQKGIILFSHKEWEYFRGNKIVKRLKRTGTLPFSRNSEIRMVFRKKLLGLAEDYYLGVHFGFHNKHYFTSELVDFVMSGESTLPNLDPKIYRIPHNSRDFTPALFRKLSQTKLFDIMTVAQNVKFKNYPLLFQSIKKFLKDNPDSSFLMLTPSQQSAKYGVQKDLAKLYYSTFDRDEQSRIAFLFLHPELQWGLDQNQLVKFYNQSRIFTLFTEIEGESRVISEALCCGLPVVVYKGLQGGGRDRLTPDNSVEFDSYESAHKSWQEALVRFPDGVKDKPEITTREDHTIVSLKNHFADFMALKSADSQELNLINLDNLYRRLPAHQYDVPWMIHGKNTADILSTKQFDIFYATVAS